MDIWDISEDAVEMTPEMWKWALRRVHALKRLVDDTEWTSPMTADFDPRCVACGGTNGAHFEDCPLIEARELLEEMPEGVNPK